MTEIGIFEVDYTHVEFLLSVEGLGATGPEAGFVGSVGCGVDFTRVVFSLVLLGLILLLLVCLFRHLLLLLGLLHSNSNSVVDQPLGKFLDVIAESGPTSSRDDEVV